MREGDEQGNAVILCVRLTLVGQCRLQLDKNLNHETSTHPNRNRHGFPLDAHLVVGAHCDVIVKKIQQEICKSSNIGWLAVQYTPDSSRFIPTIVRVTHTEPPHP
jgi:hypothetical protein